MASSSSMTIAAETLGIIVLILIFFDFGSRQQKRREFDDIVFTAILFVNVGILITDIIAWSLIGANFHGARIINIITTAIYYILQPIICFLWLIYAEYKITEDKEKILEKSLIYAIPAGAALILSVASCFIPVFFWINEHNIYHREKYYLFFTALCLIYYIYASVIITNDLIKAKYYSEKERDIFLLVYPIFPLIAVAFQSLFFGIAIVWLASVISILILYFNLQNSKITTDDLTSLNNRRRFSSYVEHKFKNRSEMPLLFILMIDIDEFKRINDRYGHIEGDKAIKNTAHIVARSVQKEDFVARAGGDEFVVVGERNDESSIISTIYEIQKEIEKFNNESTKYDISVSIGCGLLRQGEHKVPDEVLAEADRLMYQEKKLKHP